MGLYFRLKNVVVMKSPNSGPESIYIATRIQMRVNRSRSFFLRFRLKNAAVLKLWNSEPESIYLATRIQMRVNRSRSCLNNVAVLKSPNFELESIYLTTRIQMRVNAFVWRMLQCWNPQILNQRVFTYQTEYRCGLIDLAVYFYFFLRLRGYAFV